MPYVQIIRNTDPERCELQMKARDHAHAVRIQAGANINLNHRNFKVVISETPLDTKKGDA